ncbi:MAG: DUF4342 domain-containing protein [Phototrophicaceae bacterium]|jgi:phage terminase large subunit-like protein
MTENDKTKNSDPIKTVSEQIEVAGNELVDRVKQLVAEGNVRRLVFRAPDDKVMLEMSLTTSAVVGGVMALAAPWLAALGAIAALVTRMRIEIVREVEKPEVVQGTARPVEERNAEPTTGTHKVKVEIQD